MFDFATQLFAAPMGAFVVKKPQNDNAPRELTPTQVKQLQRMRALAAEMLDLADKLEASLVTRTSQRRYMESIEPSPEMFELAARARRRRGLDNA